MVIEIWININSLKIKFLVYTSDILRTQNPVLHSSGASGWDSTNRNFHFHYSQRFFLCEAYLASSKCLECVYMCVPTGVWLCIFKYLFGVCVYVCVRMGVWLCIFKYYNKIHLTYKERAYFGLRFGGFRWWSVVLIVSELYWGRPSWQPYV